MSTKSSGVRALYNISLLLVFAGVVVVFYLSWLPSPLLSNYDLLPDWLSRWTDAPENDTVRTAIPFICLGLVMGSYLSATSKGWRWWAGSWGGLLVIVFIAEAGQLVLPHRSFDWDDVLWGAAGSLGGLALTGSFFTLIKSIRNR